MLDCCGGCSAPDTKPEAVLWLCQVSELEQPMDETDGVALMDSDFPEDSLPEKPANVVQVMAQDT